MWGPTPAQTRYEGRRDLGNTQPGDGSKFRGRTAIQITGRANTAEFRDWCRRVIDPAAPDFVANPDLMNTDPWEGLGPLWYWDTRNLNQWADQGDVETITKRINGGLNGYADRLALLTRASLVLLGWAPTAIKAFQRDAQKLGYLPADDPNGDSRFWRGYRCTSCGNVVTARARPVNSSKGIIDAHFPEPRQVDQDIPPVPRRFLEQAYETLHAPDAAAVMAGSAVDAMLKQIGFADGSVYRRIEEAVSSNVLTKAMGDWAHSVRLGANRPRHADAEAPHVTREEAAQSVEFAGALGQFLFVLAAQIERGIEKAKEAGVVKG